jgi:hypothetical protein
MLVTWHAPLHIFYEKKKIENMPEVFVFVKFLPPNRQIFHQKKKISLKNVPCEHGYEKQRSQMLYEKLKSQFHPVM